MLPSGPGFNTNAPEEGKTRMVALARAMDRQIGKGYLCKALRQIYWIMVK